MSRTITAAVLRHPDEQFALEQLSLPEPVEDQILVRVVAAGMCHTDLLARQPGSFVRPPIVLGHEGSGVVEAIGPRAADIAIGDHVVLTFDSCGTCLNCLDGHPAYCTTFWPRNFSGHALNGSASATDADGGRVAAQWFGQSSFATHALASARNAVVVDATLPLHLLAPLGCSIQTGAASITRALGVTVGDSVAVFGSGSVGLAAVMAAHAAGATKIVAVDTEPRRLELAQELGATHTICGSTQELRRALKRIAPEGLDAALDTTGLPAVIDVALGALRLRGCCGLVGSPRADLTLSRNAVSLGRELKGILQGDAVPKRFIPTLVELWRAGRLPFDRLITEYALEDVNEAERAMRSGEVIKVVLRPPSA